MNNTISFTPTHMGLNVETISTLVSIAATHLFHHKVLLIDAGDNGRTTNLVSKTFGRQCYEHNIGDLLTGTPVEKVITPITDNLDFLPGMNDFTEAVDGSQLDGFADFTILRNLISPVYNQYEFVILVPSDRAGAGLANGTMAVSNIVLSTDAKQNANHVTLDYINNYLQRLFDSYPSAQFDILGIMPTDYVMFGVYKGAYKRLIEQFDHDNVYFEIVKKHNRFMKYEAGGFTLNGYYDKRMLALAADVFLETRDRINYLSKNGDITGFNYLPSWYDFVNDRLLELGKRVKNYDFIEQKQIKEQYFGH